MFPGEALVVGPDDPALKADQFLDVAATLRKSMSRIPHLKVWLSCGYYDLATPYFSNEIGVAQMMLDPSIRPNAGAGRTVTCGGVECAS